MKRTFVWPSQTAVTFSGQGSQFPGMGKDLPRRYWWVFDRANDILGFDLRRICFEGPEEKLIRTDITQPAILTVSYIKLLKALEEGLKPGIVAGHSVGEYTALIAAGVLSFEDALILVRKRGKFMSEADPNNWGIMVALQSREELKLGVIRRICQEQEIDIAAINSLRQIIISGHKDRIARASDRLQTSLREIRATRLKVSGAFHSRMMEPAKERLREAMLSVKFNKIAESGPLVVFNATADIAKSPEKIKRLLLDQLVSPVLWLKTIVRMILAGAGRFIELGPKIILESLILSIMESEF